MFVRSDRDKLCLARMRSKFGVDGGVVDGVEELVPLLSGLLSVEDG
jgi:hypothetical protein